MKFKCEAPSEGNAVPITLYQAYSYAFENVWGGSQMRTTRPYDCLDCVQGESAYVAMRNFSAVWFKSADSPRSSERILGETPINRFIFQVENGVKYYEVLKASEQDRWFVVESVGPGWYSKGKGKTKIPFWADVIKTG